MASCEGAVKHLLVVSVRLSISTVAAQLIHCFRNPSAATVGIRTAYCIRIPQCSMIPRPGPWNGISRVVITGTLETGRVRTPIRMRVHIEGNIQFTAQTQ